MYRILLLNNSLPFDLTSDCQKVVDYFGKKLPFPMQIDSNVVSLDTKPVLYKTINGFDKNTGKPALAYEYVLPATIKNECMSFVKNNTYDCVIFAYDFDGITLSGNSTITSLTDSVGLYPGTQFIQLAVNQWLETNPTENWNTMAHELVHALCWRLKQQGYPIVDEMDVDHLGRAFYRNNSPLEADSNFGFTLNNITPYFSKIINNFKPMYKFFSPSEVVGLTPALCTLLDTARGLAGVPFVITSGFRTDVQNQAVGGVKNSAHLTGQAADIATTTQNRQKILKGVLDTGIPCFLEICPDHLHIDIDALIHPLGDAILSQNG